LEREAHELEVSHLKSALKSLQKRFDACTEDCKRLRTELSAALSRAEEAETQAARFGVDFVSARERCTRLTAQLEEEHKALNAAREEAQSAYEQLSRLRRQLEETQRALQAKEAAYQEELSRLSAAREASTADAAAVAERRLAELKAAQGEISALKNRIQQLEKELSAARQQLAEAEKARTALQDLLAEQEKKTKEAEEKANAELERQAAAFADFRKGQEDIVTSLEAERRSLIQKLSDLVHLLLNSDSPADSSPSTSTDAEAEEKKGGDSKSAAARPEALEITRLFEEIAKRDGTIAALQAQLAAAEAKVIPIAPAAPPQPQQQQPQQPKQKPQPTATEKSSATKVARAKLLVRVKRAAGGENRQVTVAPAPVELTKSADTAATPVVATTSPSTSADASALQARVALLELQLRHAKGQLAAAQLETALFKQVQEARAELKRRIAEAGQKEDALRKEVDALQQKVAQLEAELKDAQRQLREQKAEKATEAAAKEQQPQPQQQQQQQQQRRAVAAAASAAVIAEKEAEIAALSKALEETKQALKAAKEELTKRLKHSAAARQAQTKLRSDLDSAQQELQAKEARIQHLQRTVAAKDALVADLRAKLQEQQQRAEQQKSGDAAGDAKEARVRELAAALQRKEAQVKELRARLDAITAECAELRERQEEVEQIRTQLKRARSDVERKESLVSSLRSQLQPLEERIRTLEQEKADLSARLEAAEVQLSRKTAALRSLIEGKAATGSVSVAAISAGKENRKDAAATKEAVDTAKQSSSLEEVAETAKAAATAAALKEATASLSALQNRIRRLLYSVVREQVTALERIQAQSAPRRELPRVEAFMHASDISSTTELTPEDEELLKELSADADIPSEDLRELLASTRASTAADTKQRAPAQQQQQQQQQLLARERELLTLVDRIVEGGSSDGMADTIEALIDGIGKLVQERVGLETSLAKVEAEAASRPASANVPEEHVLARQSAEENARMVEQLRSTLFQYEAALSEWKARAQRAEAAAAEAEQRLLLATAGGGGDIVV